MDRRELLGVLGTGAAGLAALGAGRTAVAQEGHEHDKKHDDAIKAAGRCAEVCNETFRHCFGLTEQGQRDHAHAARLALDCAEFCGLAACLMSRESELMSDACGACANACKKCAEECAKFSSETMKRCADACRECEKHCRSMSQMHAAH
jgi:hypothetical protein